MTSKPTLDIKDLTLSDLEHLVLKFGQQRHRVRQLIKWLYQKGTINFDEMTAIPKSLWETLSRAAFISSLTANKVETSKDGARKFLFSLMDGHSVESVLIPVDPG